MDILEVLSAIESGDVIAFARSIKGECDQFAEVTVGDRTAVVARIGMINLAATNGAGGCLITHEHDDIRAATECHDTKVEQFQEIGKAAALLVSYGAGIPDDVRELTG